MNKKFLGPSLPPQRVPSEARQTSLGAPQTRPFGKQMPAAWARVAGEGWFVRHTYYRQSGLPVGCIPAQSPEPKVPRGYGHIDCVWLMIWNMSLIGAANHSTKHRRLRGGYLGISHPSSSHHRAKHVCGANPRNERQTPFARHAGNCCTVASVAI